MRTLKMDHRTYRRGDNRCVFCMNVFPPAEMTNEHIIPEAIHGGMVLENGACRTCAKFSNQDYENTALNNDLQLARVLLGLRGKRGAPKDVRHLPPVYAGDFGMGGETENDRLLDFPVDLYPKSFSLLLFPPPGRIVGIDRGDDLVGLRIQDFHVGGRELTGVFTVKEARTNGPFAKMIAKIGYCFAVAEKGFAAFDGDDIRALLRGKRSDVYNFVGSLSKPEVLTARHLHGLYLRERNGWLTALVHLFASLSEEPSGAIPYEVVVGRMTTVMRA